ncbi:DUF4012 domain-containing protein [Cryobacterium arcticum]|uniref:DUF4012 domain-containing protein n=1 Tax=Cryobacterium arcticum TaxID=670052 RepID=A0A317ZU56_9MICO|nr:DUF4012 domain-containing protein [Cryobacterium arcticum]PXA68663.1 hypothetical protein CTB96_18960 [Cryobacterium arcticum]
MVKTDLEAAQQLVDQLQAQVKDGDFVALNATSAELQDRASSAVNGTHDLTWRIAEFVPVVGENLKAVRIVAESIDDVVVDVAAPAVTLLGSFDVGARDPETGGFDLAPIKKAQEIVAAATTVFSTSLEKIDTINVSSTVGPVSAAVVKLDGLMTSADAMVSDMGPLLNVAGSALGMDGPRNYLLAFQNNAESTALGGSAASYTLMHSENGAISIAAQANSGDFEEGTAVDVDVDQSALDLYSSYLVDHINTSTSRPDFPTAAKTISAFWARDQGAAVDGVISVDPLALALVLKATGPITLTSGDVLTDENAVGLLTNGIYMRYPDNEDAPKADAFFEEAAASILAKVISGEFDINTMISAVTDGINKGSIMMWVADPTQQSSLDGSRLQGTLPASNADDTVVGVYYRDTSASKIDYYLDTSTQTTSDKCSVPGTTTITTSVTLHSRLTEAQAEDLPEYVNSKNFGAEKFRTEVYVYGPVGATLASTQVDAEGLDTTIRAGASDLGRPVAPIVADLAPGETTMVTTSFTVATAGLGPLTVRGTPMIHPTDVTVTDPKCP